VDGAICRGLDGPEVVMVEGLAAHSGNVWRLHSLDDSERDLVVLDGVAGERAGRVGTRGGIFHWCLWIGEDIVRTVDGMGLGDCPSSGRIRGKVEDRCW